MNAGLQHQARYLSIAVLLHTIVLSILLFSYAFSKPAFVIENTNQHDFISAVALGDTPKSKIMPENLPKPSLAKKEANTKPPVGPVSKPQQKDVVALKHPTKPKIKTKSPDEITKALLADIKKHQDKRKTIKKERTTKMQFEKTLKEQAEKTLREQLLDEKIKLQSKVSRREQGIVNKYIALIQQAVGKHFVGERNPRLHCILKIRTAPSGRVLDVQVIKSSGNPSLDQSARTAVFNTAILPVPPDPKLFEREFREFNFGFSPQNMSQPSI